MLLGLSKKFLRATSKNLHAPKDRFLPHIISTSMYEFDIPIYMGINYVFSVEWLTLYNEPNDVP